MAWGSGDWFIDLFTAEAERLIELLARRRVPQPPPATGWWIAGLPSQAPESQPVAAVDGGGGIQPLAGGGSIYVARAYGYSSWGEPKRLLELRYYPVRDTRVLDALRSWIEHQVAMALAADAPRGTVLLMDGSLWALLTVSVSSVLRTAVSEPSGVGGLYTAMLSLYTLTAVVELNDVAARRGVTVAYVSKDHSYRFLKESILLSKAGERSPEVRELAERALAWYPLAEREALLRVRRSVGDEEVRQLMDAALDPSYRDPAFIDDSVGGSIGYSLQVSVPPPRRVAQLVVRMGVKGVVEAVCRRIEDYLGVEEASECWGTVARFASTLDRLPGVLASYLRLSPGDSPLLVETARREPGYFSPGRSLLEPGREFETLISVLVRDYGGPQYYNIPLLTAHASATLTRQQMESYIRLLEGLAAAHGLHLKLARRTLVARTTRRRRRGLPA